MDDVTLARWQQIVDRFQLAKGGANPWDAKKLDASRVGASHGELCSIRFLLNVWDPGGNWGSGPFDFIDAFRTWDEKRQRAFIEWTQDPLWP